MKVEHEFGENPDKENLKKALLIGSYMGTGNKQTCIDHLEELQGLASTYGLETLDTMLCPLKKIDVSTFVGSGKVEEIAEKIQELGAELVLFDDEIQPSQQRNLEKALKVPVMDRTELIIEVFAQRASSFEARLQIEIAKIKYQFPRLKRLWTHLSRQAGGGLATKGEGEKQIELDKRMLKERLYKLQRDLKEVQKNRDTQKKARMRNHVPTFAIIGYTNAGKSTLLNALTGAGVLAEDKLFATLDTTTRKFTLDNHQEILLTDTVGFIRKIPHTLVEAFKSTLEESLEADILLHLIDVSHPQALEQAEESLKVLKELSADKKTVLTVLNKIDVPSSSKNTHYFKIHHPKTICISAKTQEGFEELFDLIKEELSKRRQVVSCRIPQKEYQLVAEILEKGQVLYQEYEDNDVLLRVDIPSDLVRKVEEFVTT